MMAESLITRKQHNKQTIFKLKENIFESVCVFKREVDIEDHTVIKYSKYYISLE